MKKQFLNKEQVKVYKEFLGKVEVHNDQLAVYLAALKNVLGDYTHMEALQPLVDEAGSSCDHVAQVLEEVSEKFEEILTGISCGNITCERKE